MAEENVSLRQNMVWGTVAFGVALAVIIGVRLDQAALAVVVGVVCGIAASIPTSLLIVTLMRRRDVKEEKQRMRDARRGLVQSPPVVVVAPPTVPQLPRQTTWSGEYATPLPAQREFSVIGEEEIEDLW